MPARDMVIGPREGHIDLIDGVIGAAVGLSLEGRMAETGERYIILHLDVASDETIDNPFSVGIPLAFEDAQRLARLVGGPRTADPFVMPTGELLN